MTLFVLGYTSGVMRVSNRSDRVAQERKANTLDRIVAFSGVPMSNVTML